MRPKDEGQEQKDKVQGNNPKGLPRMVIVWRNREVDVVVTRALSGPGRDASDRAPKVRRCPTMKSGLRRQKLTVGALGVTKLGYVDAWLEMSIMAACMPPIVVER
jgi:hypothetical protein